MLSGAGPSAYCQSTIKTNLGRQKAMPAVQSHWLAPERRRGNFVTTFDVSPSSSQPISGPGEGVQGLLSGATCNSVNVAPQKNGHLHILVGQETSPCSGSGLPVTAGTQALLG